MKKAIFRFGAYASGFILLFFITNWTLFGTPEKNFSAQEIAGYAAILLSLSFVYFGIRYYRDHENNGQLTFIQGLKIGLLITVFPSLLFGIFDDIYILFLNPDFYEDYAKYEIAQVGKNLSPEQAAIQLKEMKKQMDLYANPVVNFLLMFFTVFIIGLIISIISAFVLKRKTSNASTLTNDLISQNK